MKEENKISNFDTVIPEGEESIILSQGRAAKEAGVPKAREPKTPKVIKTKKGKK